jgi:hypothetical protein
MVSGGTLGTSWGVGRYLPYVLVCREIPKVRPGMSRGTLGTSWVVGQEVLSVRPGVSGDTLGTSWGVGRSPDTPDVRQVHTSRDSELRGRPMPVIASASCRANFRVNFEIVIT